MRYLLHIGLFALALGAVTQADAQQSRRGDRQTTVVIAGGGGPRTVHPVRASFDPPRAIYAQPRTFNHTPKAIQASRRDYFDQRQDLDQILRISERWERATAERNRDAEWNANRSLDAWLEREIRESAREPVNQRYTDRLRLLSSELASLERSRHHGRGHYERAHCGRAHGHRGYYGRGQGGYFAKKASILNELVQLSERQLQRAEANLHYPYRFSVARR